MPQLPPLNQRVADPGPVALPADRAGLTWRPIRRDDAPAIHALRRAIGLVDHPHYVVTLDEIEHDFARDDLDTARDTIVAMDEQGRLVAYGVTALQTGQETLVKSMLDGGVHPDRRREGLGTQIADWHERRGMQQLAGSDKSLPGWLITFADERAEASIALFQGRGFELRRWWLELARDLSEPVPSIPLDPALRLETYGPEWFERTRLARNAAFRDHWGSQPMPESTWEAHARLPISRPDLAVVAVDPCDESVVAFVLTDVNEEEWPQVGHSFGYISYVGVLREWRGRRVAQALLTEVLSRYRAAGFEKAVLDVDSDSPTGAVGLYEGLGFSAVNRSVSIVKEF